MTRKRTAIAMLGMIGILLMGSPVQTVKADAASDAILYDAWIYPEEQDAFTDLSHATNVNAVKIEFLHIADDGTVVQIPQSATTPNGYSAENVAFVKAHSREQFITVSGNMQGTQLAMQNPDTLTAMVSMARSTGFGIELDWEDYGQWTPEYYASFKAYVAQLRDTLHQYNLHLIVDGPPIYDAISQAWYQWKYEEMAPLADAVTMMVYDNQYDTGVGNAIAPRNWTIGCMNWLKDKAGSKGIAGIAAYGYVGNLLTGSIRVMPSDDVLDLKGWLPVIRNADGELTGISGLNYFDYADTQTMKVRLWEAEESSISRVSVWSLGSNPWFF